MADQSLSLVFLVAGSALAGGVVTEAQAQVQPEQFSFPVACLNGDNWLALRSLPSASEGTRLAKLGPDTLFTEIRRVGDWVQVRLLSGRYWLG